MVIGCGTDTVQHPQQSPGQWEVVPLSAIWQMMPNVAECLRSMMVVAPYTAAAGDRVREESPEVEQEETESPASGEESRRAPERAGGLQLY